MEMRYFWVGDKVAQDLYSIGWYPGQKNLAEYQSKHHPVHITPWHTLIISMRKIPPVTTSGSEVKHSERVCWNT